MSRNRGYIEKVTAMSAIRYAIWKIKRFFLKPIWFLSDAQKRFITPINAGDVVASVDETETVKLKWRKSLGVKYYKVVTSDSKDFDNIIYESSEIYNFTLLHRLEYDTTYFYKIGSVYELSSGETQCMWSDDVGKFNTFDLEVERIEKMVGNYVKNGYFIW